MSVSVKYRPTDLKYSNKMYFAGDGHLGVELGELCFDVVTEDQAGQRPLKAMSTADTG